MSEPPQPEQPAFARQAKSRIGTTLSAKYTLDRLLGVGGMASVYAATHRNGNKVAVKVLHGPLSVDADIRRRFLREGYVANKVSHPGAVQVIDDCEAEDGTAYLVMELLAGESLDVRWARFDRRVPPREVLAITYELLDALAHAHAHGIVHRDIKPANLFLTVEGKLKVLDFGIARLLEATHGHAHTHTGRAVGTPAFMPPEQALGRTREIDGQTDIWAVGATMFTLLSGQDVHEAENVSEQLVYAATKPSRSLASVAPEIAPEIVQIVDKAIAFDRSARWADARAMREAVADTYASVFGEPLRTSIASIVAADDLGAVRSASPRAFAPTVRSQPPMRGALDSTEASTELRVSQLGAGHPTTGGGGALSVDGRANSRPSGTLSSPGIARRRSLGLAVAAAAVAVLAAASVFGVRTAGQTRDPALLTSGSAGTDNLATAMPVGLETPALAEPKPEPEPPAARATPTATTPSPAAPVPAASPTSTAKVKPLTPAPAISASAAAAQGGVVVTVPY